MFLIKLIIKLLISRLFLIIPETLLSKKIKIFKTGNMNTYKYSRHIFFDRHYNRMKKLTNFTNPVIMEFGPGNALSSSIFSRIVNAKNIYLVDSFELADKNINLYKTLVSELPKKERTLFKDVEFKNFEVFLESLNAKYFSNCLEDLKTLDDNSVDLIFSHSVMEHVRLEDLPELISQMYRLLKKGGLVSHVIDFSDHLDFGLNNLRFSERVWESSFFANSGFYTNRISCPQMIDLFLQKNFRIIYKKTKSWDEIPIKKSKLHKDFSHFTNEDLKHHNLEILLTK